MRSTSDRCARVLGSGVGELMRDAIERLAAAAARDGALGAPAGVARSVRPAACAVVLVPCGEPALPARLAALQEPHGAPLGGRRSPPLPLLLLSLCTMFVAWIGCSLRVLGFWLVFSELQFLSHTRTQPINGEFGCNRKAISRICENFRNPL